MLSLFEKVLAQVVSENPPSTRLDISNPLRFNDLTDLLSQVAKWLFYIAAPIVTIMILYGAFQIMTASGNPEQFEKGKRTILYSIIGFIVILIAAGIPELIGQLLGKK